MHFVNQSCHLISYGFPARMGPTQPPSPPVPYPPPEIVPSFYGSITWMRENCGSSLAQSGGEVHSNTNIHSSVFKAGSNRWFFPQFDLKIKLSSFVGITNCLNNAGDCPGSGEGDQGETPGRVAPRRVGCPSRNRIRPDGPGSPKSILF